MLPLNIREYVELIKRGEYRLVETKLSNMNRTMRKIGKMMPDFTSEKDRTSVLLMAFYQGGLSKYASSLADNTFINIPGNGSDTISVTFREYIESLTEKEQDAEKKQVLSQIALLCEEIRTFAAASLAPTPAPMPTAAMPAGSAHAVNSGSNWNWRIQAADYEMNERYGRAEHLTASLTFFEENSPRDKNAEPGKPNASETKSLISPPSNKPGSSGLL